MNADFRCIFFLGRLIEDPKQHRYFENINNTEHRKFRKYRKTFYL